MGHAPAATGGGSRAGIGIASRDLGTATGHRADSARIRLPGGRIRPQSRHPSPGDGRLRGILAGTTVMVLAVAAHGLAGGGYPGSTALTLLLLAAATGGAIIANLPQPAGKLGRATLFAVLSGAQLTGHAALSGTIGHDHGAPVRESAHAADILVAGVHLPAGPMLAAHALATLLCTILIGAADRLYAVVSQTIRAIVGAPCPPPPFGSVRWPGSVTRSYRFLRLGAIAPRAPPVPV
ncbi:hypothetical protein [Nocardia wallacei]|uniref:hypothetical protein n=1 Tax=Nocardia wallacei TaxID=480035 RepID=UPI002454E505|nr:hypothetical protein [Nocardia wallacei]